MTAPTLTTADVEAGLLRCGSGTEVSPWNTFADAVVVDGRHGMLLSLGPAGGLREIARLAEANLAQVED